MTALAWYLTDDHVVLAGDSVVCDGATRKPLHYATKLFPLPHLSGALCGTGSLDVVLDWFTVVQRCVIARSVLYLNTIGPEQLRQIAARYPDSGRTTVYHFAWDEGQKRFRAFALRSERGFECEELEPGIGVKPSMPQEEIARAFASIATINDNAEVRIESIDALAATMKRLRELDDVKPRAERDMIGGQIHALTLTREGQMMWTCHEYPDYLQGFQEMLEAVRTRG